MTLDECGAADGATSDVELMEVTLLDTGSELELTWVTEDDPPATIGYNAYIVDEATDPVFDLAVEFYDGEEPSYFVMDFGEGTAANLPATQEEPTRTFTTAFPRSLMPGIGESFAWRAGAGGEDAAYFSECLEGGERVPYP